MKYLPTSQGQDDGQDREPHKYGARGLWASALTSPLGEADGGRLRRSGHWAPGYDRMLIMPSSLWTLVF